MDEGEGMLTAGFNQTCTPLAGPVQPAATTTHSNGSVPLPNLLLPTQKPQPTSQMTPSSNLSSVPVGSTWSNIKNLNINIDNLSLGGRSKATGNAPSMNQLAGTPTSPARTPAPGFPIISPVYSPQTPTTQSAHFPTFK